MNEPSPSKHILPVIVISQFFGTSLWFAANAILPDLVQQLGGGAGFLANLTSAVQIGFIGGTFVFALLAIADRFSPSKVFFTCAVIAALFNLGVLLLHLSFTGLFTSRFLTGFFLAGIYPVGMKITSDHYRAGLGKSLGFLVGALVLGTSFPHLLKTLTVSFSWKYVIYIVSALALLGGVMVGYLIPDGPFRKKSQQLRWTGFVQGFANKKFRSAALGYFGHMWELYAFWAFVPVMLQLNENRYHHGMNISLLSFVVIAGGSLACVAGGYISQQMGVKQTAMTALSLSGACCLLSPLILGQSSAVVLMIFLIFWGWVVIADSPLFSTLIAQNADEKVRGSSLTIVNCIGFFITIVSIQVIRALSGTIDAKFVYMLLAIGPVLGLMALRVEKSFSVGIK